MRSEQYEHGRRNAIKACVEWLHARAAEMNDPHARNVLNSAAFDMGRTFKDGGSTVLTAPSASGDGKPQEPDTDAGEASECPNCKDYAGKCPYCYARRPLLLPAPPLSPAIGDR
jgi:hypothetical protein